MNRYKLDTWRQVELFEVVEINSRLVDPRIDPYSDMILIAPDHIEQKNGRIISIQTAKDQQAKSNKYLVNAGDVIYSKIRPYLMKCAIAPENCLCSADMYPFTCSYSISPIYLKNILLSSHFTEFAKSCSNRTGIPKINREELSKYSFFLPPLPEQKAIADLLSTWDEAIEKMERLIRAKEMRFKRLLDVLNSKPKNSLNDAKWKTVKIGSFLTESRISGKNGRNAQKITVKLYGKGVIAKDRKSIGSETTKYYIRKGGQFIYSTLDFLNGAFGIIPEELDGFETTLDLPTFDVSDSVSKEWFLFFITRPTYYTRQLRLAKGQRKARRIKPSEFLNSNILLPPIEIQKKISKILSSSQHEIDLAKQLSEKYKTQKSGLMQKLLTGKWRIKQDVIKANND